MRPKLSILTLFRSPAKTIVTFVLLLATSFAFVSRGAEYAATLQAAAEAEAVYTAVGTLERSTEGYYAYMEDLLGEEAYELEGGSYIDRLSNATALLEAEAVDLVLGSGHIAQDEFFMVAGGRSTGDVQNVAEQPLYDILNYADWDWELKNGTFEMDAVVIQATYFANEHPKHGEKGLFVDKVIIGEKGLLSAGDRIVVARWFTDAVEDVEVESHAAEVADNPYFQNGHSYVIVTNYYSAEYVPELAYPIVDLTELESEYGVTDYMEAFSDPERYGLPEFEHLVDLPLSATTDDYIRTLDRNFNTAELLHISGMDALHKFHNDELYIVDGRAITDKDSGNICVVSAEYALYNELKVGDTIEFEMSADTLAHSGKVFSREPLYPPYEILMENDRYGSYAIRETASEQQLTERGLDTVTQTYEIVGIWSDPTYEVSDPFSYSPNTVFVPMSTYPWAGEVEPALLPSTFSFTLNHPGDMAKIEAELGDTLAALGYELSINDMGYAEAAPSLEFMKLSALIGFVAMSAALLLSLVLITYLFIIRKKHDYAIMRALGTTRSRSNRSLLVGLFALAIPAVFLGSLLALALTQGFAADLSAQISEITGSATASTMPAWLVGAFGAGVLGLLLVFARIGLVRVGRTPPLALLQGR